MQQLNNSEYTHEAIFSSNQIVSNDNIEIRNSDYSSQYKTPLTLEETELTQVMLEDLIAKHLFDKHIASVIDLSNSMKLISPIIESLIALLKADGRLEVLRPQNDSTLLRYKLSESGVNHAKSAFQRNGYRGPAPISSSLLSSSIQSQSIKNKTISKTELTKAFSNIVINEELLMQLGAAMNSKKAVFIYGDPGTGKTYVSQKLSRLLGDPVMVPYSVAVGDTIVSIFDPLIHSIVSDELDKGHHDFSKIPDARFCLCQRPFVTSGGELAIDDLEIQYDEVSRVYQAPLQLKASNGIYLIDDLGRQRMSPGELFNRWIVPMESNEDVLVTQSGERLSIPFDLVLIFSTNLTPEKLVDGAFLRRIGHKIEFKSLTYDQFEEIWKLECQKNNLKFDLYHLEYLFDQLYENTSFPPLACHPRDLVEMAMDFERFNDNHELLSLDSIQKAWDSNFSFTSMQ